MMISYGEIQVWNRDCFAAEIPPLTKHVTSLAGYALENRKFASSNNPRGRVVNNQTACVMILWEITNAGMRC